MNAAEIRRTLRDFGAEPSLLPTTDAITEWYYSSGIAATFDRDRLFEIALPTHTSYPGFLVYSGTVVNGVKLTDGKETILNKLGRPEKVEGLDHGLCRHYNVDGTVSWEVTCVRGKAHGVSRQYDRNGNLIGTARWHNGTGVDLWYDEDRQLSEERHIRNGLRHGFERWWSDERSVWSEYHFQQGIDHGIHREWNAKGRLRRGFPRYFINGLQVTKRQYVRACERDSSLPKFRKMDNMPSRELPRTLTSGPANTYEDSSRQETKISSTLKKRTKRKSANK